MTKPICPTCGTPADYIQHKDESEPLLGFHLYVADLPEEEFSAMLEALKSSYRAAHRDWLAKRKAENRRKIRSISLESSVLVDGKAVPK